MNPFSWLFRKPKTVDDIFDKDDGLLAKAGNYVGNLHFTEEEKAEMNAEQLNAVRDFVVATLSENTDRSKARREIAVFFMKLYGIMIFMCGMTASFDTQWSKAWFSLITSMSVTAVVGAITVFFYGSYTMARHQETKK